jgi:peptidoglycan glycosyltransferase
MPPKLRPIWVLGAGAVVVTTAMLTTRGGSPSEASASAHDAPAMAIGAEPLVAPPAPAPAPAPQLFAAPAPAPAAEALPGSLLGDASLAGQIDLDRMTLAGDHYEVVLADGRRAILTLDPAIQQAAEKTLSRAKAPMGAIAVVATDGRVLALAGRRTDDHKGGKDGTMDWHLALGAWAPAASIFKIVSSAALVEAGVAPDAKVCFHGGLRSVTESNLTDAKNDSRCEDLTFAVAHSQNAIIAKLAHKYLEPRSLGEMAKRLGFSGPLPAFALTGDAGAVDLPADNGVEFARTAAGFTGTHLSATGGALLANAIATGGQAVTPRIVDAIVDGGRRVEITGAKPRRAIDATVAAQVGRMMEQTCTRGTAAKAFHGRRDELPGGIQVAGKTGTLAKTDPFYMEYSWFVGYAPADHPTMSIAVVLGNAESWWMKGHQAARSVLATALAKHDTVADRR